MGAAVDDVQHRHGQDARVRPADPAVERDAGVLRRRLRGGERAPEDGVRAEPALRGCPVEVDHGAVDLPLVGGVTADQQVGELAVHVADRLRHALAEPGALVAVP